MINSEDVIPTVVGYTIYDVLFNGYVVPTIDVTLPTPVIDNFNYTSIEVFDTTVSYNFPLDTTDLGTVDAFLIADAVETFDNVDAFLFLGESI